MSIRLLYFFLISIFSNFDVTAQAKHGYPLEKIGTLTDGMSLDYYYSRHVRPLIIINNTIYIPDDHCVELRNYDGAIGLKDLQGLSEEKTADGEIDEKTSASQQEKKTQDGAEDDKHTGEQHDAKEHGAAVDQKDRGAAVDEKENDGDSDKKTGSGDKDLKTTDGAEAERTGDGESETKNAVASTDEKSYGAVTLYVKCKEAGQLLDLIDFYSNEKISIFDIRGLRKVDSVNIEYE